jgi:hypothetical protein
MDVFDMAVKKTGFSVNNVEPYGSVAEDWTWRVFIYSPFIYLLIILHIYFVVGGFSTDGPVCPLTSGIHIWVMDLV